VAWRGLVGGSCGRNGRLELGNGGRRLSEGWSSGDYENGIEDAEKERRDQKAVARANRLRIEGREESEEDSEDGDSSEGKLYNKEGVVRDGCPSTNILNIIYIFFKLFYRDIKELFNF